MNLIVSLHTQNAVRPPKEKGGPFRVRLVTPYLGNADTLFDDINNESFSLVVDEKTFSAVLNQELAAPFRIIPGDNPVIEIIIDVYTTSYDYLISGNSYSLTK